MNKRGNVVVVIVILVVALLLVLLGYFIARHDDTNNTSNAGSAISTPSNAPKGALPSTANGTEITFDDFGFSPNIVSVPAGSTITVTNQSTSGPIVFEPVPGSAPNNAMNLGTIQMGQSKTFTATTKGSWQFEDENAATYRGMLTVT